MGNKSRITESIIKGHRLTVTLEDPIYKELQKNIGKTEKFASESHAINFSLAQVLGVKGE